MNLNYNYYDPPKEWDGRYIHFGDLFDRKKIEPIKNRFAMTKPSGGFWASRNCKDGFNWIDYNHKVLDKWIGYEKHISFPLKKGANVVEIHCSEDLNSLPKIPKEKLPGDVRLEWTCLDFEKMLADGIDAIEVRGIAEDRDLYFDLYGWDCDSILIMNPDIIDYSEIDELSDLVRSIPWTI
ncbi:hypothetical protein SAMN05216391_10861 [Lachnospiraceae bacterium KHCPX20]|nr:hypothetical protein SAMN05216391_10861 [Lachnospiraceae bacterium KHCPX20]